MKLSTVVEGMEQRYSTQEHLHL